MNVADPHSMDKLSGRSAKGRNLLKLGRNGSSKTWKSGDSEFPPTSWQIMVSAGRFESPACAFALLAATQ